MGCDVDRCGRVSEAIELNRAGGRHPVAIDSICVYELGSAAVDFSAAIYDI